MKSITIHGIDETLSSKISEKAEEFGLSQNRTVKHILQNSLFSDNKIDKRNSYLELCGKWNDSDKKEFEQATNDFELIHEMDWK